MIHKFAQRILPHWRVLMILIVVWICLFQLERWDRNRELADAGNANEILARSFAEHARLSFEQADRLTQYVKMEAERDQTVSNSIHFLFRQLRSNPAVLRSIVADSAGNVMASSSPLASPENIRESEQFTVHAAIDSGTYLLNRPVQEPISGQWSLSISRRLNSPDGSFAGIVSVAMDPQYYSRFYERTIHEGDAGVKHTVNLIGTEGIIRVRYDGNGNNLGQDISDRPVFAAMKRQSQGTWIGEGLLLQNRLLSFQKIDQLPLYVTVGADIDDILSGRKRHQWVLSLTGISLTLLISLLYLGLHRALSYERKLKESLKIELHQQERWQQQLHEISMRDSLTGLYNRLYWEDYLKKAATVPAQKMGILVVDIDGLKLVNNTLGDSKGGSLLQQTADSLLQCGQSGDLVARIGDDDFVLVRPQADEAEMAGLAAALRRAAEKRLFAEPGAVLNLSIGYAAKESTDMTVGDLFHLADDRMRRERLHRTQGKQGGIIDTLVAMLAARDCVTEGHAGRMEALVESVALKMGLDPFRIGDLRLFAHFHDIGKVGIPDDILKKPGALTAKEREEMERHCEIGYRIARASPELSCIADWILQHHERWDGKGYPMQYAGEIIPVECRILSVVDAYDAMVSDRPYRKALPRQVAIAELQAKSGSQFDPEVVKTFLQVIVDQGRVAYPGGYTEL